MMIAGGSLLTNGATDTTFYPTNLWGTPEFIKFYRHEDQVEALYKETSRVYLSHIGPETRVFKIVYSCIDGQWNESERIYGEIIPATKEDYEFPDEAE